jgi:hypothetical protein
MPDLITASPKADMQAVVVIHGMGEQIPMDTIKGFVDAVWQTDDSITPNGFPHPTEVWSKPDVRTGSLELRRITTRESIPSAPEFPAGVRTDFYELYWADLTGGATWWSLTSWARGLLFRPLGRVPPGVRPAWLVLWLGSLVIVALAVLAALPTSLWKEPPYGLLVTAAVAITALVHRMGTSTFGRVVRYTRADPENIAARASVRNRGLKLLRALHDGPHYKRIIIVGHSLGAMLAYDLLSYFWAERDPARTVVEGTPEFAALCTLEHAAAQLEEAPSDQEKLNSYFIAQRQLRRLLAGRPAPLTPNQHDQRWLISDLVTFGSPLTHAEFLIAADRADLEVRKAARELPQSPPFREFIDPNVLKRAKATHVMPIANPAEKTRLTSYPVFGATDAWMLHHAAPFAVVRWTNIYDPAALVFFGDVISGPVAGIFGPAIIDVNLKRLRGRQSWTFTHTKYWALDEASRIAACRHAVNLLDRLI